MVSIRSAVTLLLLVTLSLAAPAAAQPLSGPEFIPLVTPCRALDTRATGTPIPANVPITLQISGVTTGGTDCGVPLTAVAAALNFTITQPQGPGWLTAWPSGPLPVASVVNFVAGETVANAVDIMLGAAGTVPGGTVFVQSVATTHLVVDIYGYFTDVEELAGFNTALGINALAINVPSNTAGAPGVVVLPGTLNTALGFSALGLNTVGAGNTAVGASALALNATGSGNIAIGFNAGLEVTGSNNIHIGNAGNSADFDRIRIGTVGSHTSAFVAGIFGATTFGGTTVEVNNSGQLGTVLSSRRVKDDIRDMEEASGGLVKLRAVTFRYKAEHATGPRQREYGLIAEEVAEIYPELVVLDKDGQPSGVRYHVLPAMLLNEVQKQHAQLQEQAARLDAQQREIDELRARVRALIGGQAAVRE